jgi:hypothetical protein
MMAAVAMTGLLAMPALAATAKSAGGDKPTAHHGMSCYDYAWQSQEMKDCLAKKTSAQKPASHKHTHKKTM